MPRRPPWIPVHIISATSKPHCQYCSSKHRLHPVKEAFHLPVNCIFQPQVSPIKLPVLWAMLANYSSVKAKYLLDGFCHGFKLECSSSCPPTPMELPVPPDFNHASARRHPMIVTQKLYKEIEAGRMLGPFFKPPLSQLQVSPIALVEKKTPGEYRLIHDLSHPEGASVNDDIDRHKGYVHYDKLDDAIETILELGPGCFMAKTDIAHAFKLVPINVNDFCRLGIFWEGNYYIDITLPMGARTSPAFFPGFQQL